MERCDEKYPKEKHDWDDDGVCTKCGFDGAEDWHLNPDRLDKIARDNEY